jgi:hypothetical protein
LEAGLVTRAQFVAGLRFVVGPDGREFVCLLGESMPLRRRMPRRVHRSLLALTTDNVVDDERLNDVLMWVYRLADTMYVFGPVARARAQQNDDAYEVLTRFRRVAREMLREAHRGSGRRSAEVRELEVRLHEAEGSYIRAADPGWFLLTDDNGEGGRYVSIVLRPKKRAHRPAEPWRAVARKALIQIRVPAKLASHVVAAIARDVKDMRGKS